MKISVADLYKYSKLQNVPLLGSANYDFWTPYTSGFTNFDRYFRNRFKSWLYFESFADGESAEDMHTDFTETIAAHLAINSKRYSELYRVQILENDAYDIVNNYDLHESHTNTRSESGTNTSGEREDTTADGARTDTGSATNGAQSATTTGKVQGFNSSTFANKDFQQVDSAERTDTTSITTGAQTSTTTKGEQTDSHSTNGTENITIRKYGNIGVQTPADVIGGHIELWQDLFNFYKLIFDEIAKEYLLLTDAYEDDNTSGGGGSSSESLIMRELAEIKAQITASTTAIRGDISTNTGAIRGDISTNTTAIRGDISTSTTAIRGDISTNTSAIRKDIADIQSAVSAVDGKTDDIIESIEGVTTNEY